MKGRKSGSAALRSDRIRRKIRATGLSSGRFRLSVFRSSKNIYAQVIDDSKGVTLASASPLEKEVKEAIGSRSGVEMAAIVGRFLGERAVKAGIKRIVFDKGPYKYHGRVMALASAAREAGLDF